MTGASRAGTTPPATRRLEYISIDDLQRAPRNPKGHDQAGIAASIGRHGFVEPVIVDERTGFLVGGHGRLEALQRARERGEDPPEGITVTDGAWLVPTVLGWSSRSDADAEALLVGLNQLPAAGGWQPRALAEILSDLAKLDDGLVGTGYVQDDLTVLLESLRVPEFAPAPADAQPRLDVRNPTICPNCGHQFHRG